MPKPLGLRTEVFNQQERREEIIRYIRWFRDKQQYSPSMSEIARYLCVSQSTVFYDMQQLREAGRLDYQKHKARSICLIETHR